MTIHTYIHKLFTHASVMPIRGSSSRWDSRPVVVLCVVTYPILYCTVPSVVLCCTLYCTVLYLIPYCNVLYTLLYLILYVTLYCSVLYLILYFTVPYFVIYLFTSCITVPLIETNDCRRNGAFTPQAVGVSTTFFDRRRSRSRSCQSSRELRLGGDRREFLAKGTSRTDGQMDRGRLSI